ncbi:hypothetical protein ACLMJK_001644 [Lecanora helva]
MIREDYAKKYLDLEGEARSLGWSKADISGSVTEMQLEMDEALGEWKGQGNEDREIVSGQSPQAAALRSIMKLALEL